MRSQQRWRCCRVGTQVQGRRRGRVAWRAQRCRCRQAVGVVVVGALRCLAQAAVVSPVVLAVRCVVAAAVVGRVPVAAVFVVVVVSVGERGAVLVLKFPEVRAAVVVAAVVGAPLSVGVLLWRVLLSGCTVVVVAGLVLAPALGCVVAGRKTAGGVVVAVGGFG